MSQGFVTELAIWYTLACRREASAPAIRVMPRQRRSTGIRSRHFASFVGSWRKKVPSRYESDADVLTPSFHPRNGSSTDDSTMAGRTTAMAARGLASRKFRIRDSERLFVNVYVLGHPSSPARSMPALVRVWRTQRRRF